MDNIQLILYILFLVGYFIFKMVTGKGKAGPHREGHETFDTGNAPHAPPYQEARSLEEILEEIVTGEKKEKEPVSKPVEIEAESVEKDSWYDDETFSQYEKAVSGAKKYELLHERKEPEIVMGEVEDLDEAGPDYAAANSYLDMLKDPEGIHKAIVMNEIINRKY